MRISDWSSDVCSSDLNSDPTRDLRGALISPKVTHYGAITDPAKAGELLVAIDGYDGHGVTKLALQISPHVFVRPGELRQAQWGEIDVASALWSLTAEKKIGRAHV